MSMARVRLLNPAPKKRGVMTLQEWVRLGQKALQAATAAGNERMAKAIQAGLQEGNPSRTLKRLGIICEADIQREFGPKT